MLETFFIALWIFIPAGLANMAPVFANKLPFLGFLNIPIDGGKELRGRRIFGANKTVRGFLAGFVFALVGVLLQRLIWHNVGLPCIQCGLDVNYRMELVSVNAVLLAVLYSLGALGGDAIESFFKRQLGKPSGSTWFPFDQLDYIVGGLLATWPIAGYNLRIVLIITGLFFVLHIISTFIGYLLGLKDAPI